MPTTMRIQLKFGQGLDFAALGFENDETWDFEVDQNCTIEEVKQVLLQLCDGELSIDQLRLRRKDSSEELAEYVGADRACTSTFQPRPCTLLYHGIKSGSVLEVDILLSEDEKAGLRAWQAQVEAVNNQHAGQGEKRRVGGDECEGDDADADFMRSPPPKRRKADAAQQGSGDPMDWAEGQATGPGQAPPPPQQAPPPPQQHHLAPEKTALVEILVDSDDDYVALVEPLDVAGAPQHAPSGEAPPPKHPGRDQPPPPRPQQQQATDWEQAHGSHRQQQRGQPATEPQQGQAAQQWQKKAPAGESPRSAHGQTQQAAAGRQDTLAQGRQQPQPERQQPQVPKGQQQQVQPERQEPQGAERRQQPRPQHHEWQPQQLARQQPPTQAPESQQADQPQQRPQAPGRQRPQVPQQVQRQQQQQPVPEQPLPQVPEQQPPPQVPERQQQQPGPRQQPQPQAPQRSPPPQTAGRQPQQQQPPGRPPLPMEPTQHHQQQQRQQGQAAQEPGPQRQQEPMAQRQWQQQAAQRQEPGAVPNTGAYGAAGGVESDDEGADGGGLQARGGRAAQRPLGRAKWTIAETQALADAMETYGKCWSALEREAGLRDQKTLRYKWRNLVSMCKAGWVGMRGVQLPQPLRDQITALYQRLGA